MKQGAEGVKYLHDKGIVHGDIKGVKAFLSFFCLRFVDASVQANFLVDEELNICVADFGVSKFVESSTTSMGMSVSGGTLHWTAPELMKEAKPSYATDVYAFGCTCLEVRLHTTTCLPAFM